MDLPIGLSVAEQVIGKALACGLSLHPRTSDSF